MGPRKDAYQAKGVFLCGLSTFIWISLLIAVKGSGQGSGSGAGRVKGNG